MDRPCNLCLIEVTIVAQPSSSSSSSSSDASSKPDPNKVNWTYVQNGAKAVTLTGYDSTCKEPDRVLTLPSQIDGYTVTDISGSAFSGTSISELSLPASVKTIGKAAFSGTGISYLVLPEGITEIESGAFGGCDNLRNVYIPASVKYIDSDAFSVGVVDDVFGVPLETVYYGGSEAAWKQIDIATGNDKLSSAEKHYNAKPTDLHF